MDAKLLQPVLLLLAAAAFFGSFLLGLARIRAAARAGECQSDPSASRLAAQPCQPGMSCFLTFMIGLALALALLVWRFAAGKLAVHNDLDVFLLLGLALAGLVGYFRITHHLIGLALFIVPMIGVIMGIGGVVALVAPSHDIGHRPLTIVHVISIVGGTVALSAGAVGGMVYLLAARQLRRKGSTSNQRWIGLPSLAATEKFVQHAVLLGFPLLTLAIITGFIRAGAVHRETNRWIVLSKVLLSVVAWVAYTPLLHVNLLPAFRGRRAAWLSIWGLGLLLVVFVASYWLR